MKVRDATSLALQTPKHGASSHFGTARQALHKMDCEGKIVWANDAELDLLGYRPHEYIGHRVDEFHVDRQLCANMLDRLFGGARVLSQPARLRCGDGSIKDVLIHSNGWFADGRFLYSRCFTREVTEPMRAEREALAAMIESSQDAIIGQTLDGVISSWNAAAERLFGYAKNEAIGRPLTIIVPPDEREHQERILEQLRRGELVEYCETVFRSRAGARIFFGLTVSALRDSRGDVVGALEIARDLAGRKRMPDESCEDERRLSKGAQVVEAPSRQDGSVCASKLLIPDAAGEPGSVGAIAHDAPGRVSRESGLGEEDRHNDEFLATLAHELRNPLAPLRSGLDILRMTPNGSAAAGAVYDMMGRQIAHIVRLIDDLSELSCTHRGVSLQCDYVDLGTIVARALEMSKPLIESRAHVLDLTLPHEPVTLQADAVRLAQAFSNLLTNAAKYTEEGGRITVTAERKGSEAVVSVRDSGIGIPAAMLERVFEPFVRAENSRCASVDGSGIGLNLARKLIEVHGGTIAAKSKGLGEGSEFTVCLPVVRGAAPAAVGTGVERDGKTGEIELAQRFLVVDDNKDAANSLGMLLAWLDADVRIAYDGPSALENVRSFRPSIILLDLGMQGMSGYEVAQLIREDPDNESVLLVALTGWARDQDRSRSRAAGFDHFMIKPVDLPALRALAAFRQH